MGFVSWQLELVDVSEGVEPNYSILTYYAAFKKYTWTYHHIECLMPFINTQNIQLSCINQMVYSQGQKNPVSKYWALYFMTQLCQETNIYLVKGLPGKEFGENFEKLARIDRIGENG